MRRFRSLGQAVGFHFRSAALSTLNRKRPAANRLDQASAALAGENTLGLTVNANKNEEPHATRRHITDCQMRLYLS